MTTLASLFITVSLQQGLPPGLLSALCFIETRHEVSVVHFHDGASHSYGVCQIKYETAKQMGFSGTPEQLLIPATNIHYAGKFLRHQINRYHNVQKGVIAYNRGHAGDRETTDYQLRVYREWNND